MLSDEGPNARRRVLTKTLSQDDIPRIPPASEKLFENLPWLGIMADIAITAAVAEIKVLRITSLCDIDCVMIDNRKY